MEIDLSKGRKFEVKSMDRALSREFLEFERSEADLKTRLDMQDRVLRETYGDEAYGELLTNNRDLLDVYSATVGWSMGGSEESIKNLSRSGAGSATRTD